MSVGKPKARHELGARAVGRADADGVPVFAEIEAAHAALPAGAVEQRGIDGDEIADLQVPDLPADRDHLAAELVAGNDRVAGGGELAADDMNVGAADATGLDFDQRLVGRRGRVCDLFHGHLIGFFDHDRFHLTAPIVRPRISCFCAIQPARSTGRLASVAAAASLA